MAVATGVMPVDAAVLAVVVAAAAVLVHEVAVVAAAAVMIVTPDVSMRKIVTTVTRVTAGLIIECLMTVTDTVPVPVVTAWIQKELILALTWLNLRCTIIEEGARAGAGAGVVKGVEAVEGVTEEAPRITAILLEEEESPLLAVLPRMQRDIVMRMNSIVMIVQRMALVMQPMIPATIAALLILNNPYGTLRILLLRQLRRMLFLLYLLFSHNQRLLQICLQSRTWAATMDTIEARM